MSNEKRNKQWDVRRKSLEVTRGGNGGRYCEEVMEERESARREGNRARRIRRGDLRSI